MAGLAPTHGEVTVADAEARTPGLQHDTDLPRASERTSPIVRGLLAALAVGLGVAAIGWGIGALGLTAAADDENDAAAAGMTILGGVFFLVSGVMIWRDSLLWTAVAAALGVTCGVVSTVVM